MNELESFGASLGQLGEDSYRDTLKIQTQSSTEANDRQDEDRTLNLIELESSLSLFSYDRTLIY